MAGRQEFDLTVAVDGASVGGHATMHGYLEVRMTSPFDCVAERHYGFFDRPPSTLAGIRSHAAELLRREYRRIAAENAEKSSRSREEWEALANRFLHVEMREDAESWISWALRHDIHPSVLGFIRYRPEMLFRQEGENLERGWPTPRAWERVSRMLSMFGKEDEGLLRKVVYGLVGDRAGVEFMSFHKMNMDFDDTLEMMTNPDCPCAVPERADRKYALCSSMAYLLWRGEDKADEERRIDGFFRICMKLTSDFASMAMMDAMAGKGGRPEEDCVEKLFAHRMYRQWAEKHGQAMRRHMKIG